MVNWPTDPSAYPAAYDMTCEERDMWRRVGVGDAPGACRHPDPPYDHVADMPHGARITRTDLSDLEVRTKRRDVLPEQLSLPSDKPGHNSSPHALE